MAQRRIGGYAGHKKLEELDYTVGAAHTKDQLGSVLRRLITDKKPDLTNSFNRVAEEDGSIFCRNLDKVWDNSGVGIRLSHSDRSTLTKLLPNTGKITQAEFKSFLQEHGNFDVQPRKSPEVGNRMVGYSGHRRLSQNYASVGKSPAKIVSASVRQRIAGKGQDFKAFFSEMDTNSDGILQFEELKAGLLLVDGDMNEDQIKAIHKEMTWKTPDNLIKIDDFCSWMNEMELPVVNQRRASVNTLQKRETNAQWRISYKPKCGS